MKKQVNIDARKIHILGLIVQEYIQTGAVTGSKSLVKNQDEITVSPATVRNDMNSLEKMGLIYQPYNSAGRLPTTQGIRMYVDYLMTIIPQHLLNDSEQFHTSYTKDSLYEMTQQIATNTKEISFVCFPKSSTLYYCGVGNFLKKHGSELGESVFEIIHILENRYSFFRLLDTIDTTAKVQIHIGEENIIPELESCSLTIKQVQLGDEKGYLGIIGSKRTDYAYNINTLRNILS